MNYAVAVIGSGPAGLSAAISCRQAGLPTLLISSLPFANLSPSSRAPETIPETLAPTARVPLQNLGMWEDFVACGFPSNFAVASVWGTSMLTERHSIYNASGAGWCINRQRLNSLLFSHATASKVDRLAPARIASAERRGGRWYLKLTHSGESEVSANVVIDTSGRASVFARLIGIYRHHCDQLVCVAGHLASADEGGGESLVESAEQGWWFSVPASTGYMAVGFFTDGRVVKSVLRDPGRWLDLLNQTKYTKRRVSHCRGLAGLHARPAATSYLLRHASEGWLAIGDASLCGDPLSSQGLLRAIEEGSSAGVICRHALSGSDDIWGFYNAQRQIACKRFLAQRLQVYASESRWANSPFWCSRSGDLSSDVTAPVFELSGKKFQESV